MTLMVWIFWCCTSALIGIGLFAQRKIQHADDFATARGGAVLSFLPWLLLPLRRQCNLRQPALSYEWGLAANWVIYTRWCVLRHSNFDAASHRRKSIRQSIDSWYLGDRYQSEAIRIMVSILSLVLFFYLAGQLVSGVVMFEIMLGLDSTGRSLLLQSFC